MEYVNLPTTLYSAPPFPFPLFMAHQLLPISQISITDQHWNCQMGLIFIQNDFQGNKQRLQETFSSIYFKKDKCSERNFADKSCPNWIGLEFCFVWSFPFYSGDLGWHRNRNCLFMSIEVSGAKTERIYVLFGGIDTFFITFANDERMHSINCNNTMKQ